MPKCTFKVNCHSLCNIYIYIYIYIYIAGVMQIHKYVSVSDSLHPDRGSKAKWKTYIHSICGLATPDAAAVVVWDLIAQLQSLMTFSRSHKVREETAVTYDQKATAWLTGPMHVSVLMTSSAIPSFLLSRTRWDHTCGRFTNLCWMS